jgi:hypothetical protein
MTRRLTFKPYLRYAAARQHPGHRYLFFRIIASRTEKLMNN